MDDDRGDEPLRRFGIGDLMIIVAAVALGLSAVPVLESLHRSRPTLVACLVLQALTIAAIPLRMRHPRPSRRRYVSEPVVPVVIASIITAAIPMVQFPYVMLSSSSSKSPPDTGWALFGLLHGLGSPVSMSSLIAMGWLVLFLNGLWRRADDWVDRYGRVLGITWIAFGFIYILRPVVEVVLG